jgi:hypothetical protein
MKVWTGYLDCPPPGTQRQPLSLQVNSNPRLGRVAISTSCSATRGDDLLLCGPTESVISQATESLLNFLVVRGHKISKEKA